MDLVEVRQMLIDIAPRIVAKYPVPYGDTLEPEQERLYYGYHAKSSKFSYKVANAKQVIDKALLLDAGASLSCSFGKDSLVLLHLLVVDCGLKDLPVVFSDRGLEGELPETYELIAKLRAMFDFNYVPVYPVKTMFELYQELGGVPGISTDDSTGVIKRNNLQSTIDAWCKDNGYGLNFMGRRIEENPKTRGKHLMVRGALHFNKGRDMWTCDPLYNWTGKDIWAYIVSRALPYHPSYDFQFPEGRERIRLSNWSGAMAAESGRFAFLQKYYPELFNIYAGLFPEIRDKV